MSAAPRVTARGAIAKAAVSGDCEGLRGWGIDLPGDPVEAATHAYAPHRRLQAALGQDRQGVVALGAGDLVALTRAVLEAEAARPDGASTIVVPRALADRVRLVDWASASVEIHEDGPTGVRVTAGSWHPVWLEGGTIGVNPTAALYEAGPRRPEQPVPGDPMLRHLGWETYHADAQREAVRTVTSAPPGSTVIVNLPTGAGKSACALLPALLARSTEAADVLGVTPIIVPTVALQRDLEARAGAVVSHATAYRPEQKSAEDIAARTRAGVQGPVFLSPESLVGSFAEPLRSAARHGTLRAFVVDEAHMITAWGDDFRPAFQQIAALRRELLSSCPGRPFTTVLMSATLTPYSLDALYDLFGAPGPVHHVHAVRLRPEPSFWMHKAADDTARRAAVLDAIRHLPRPLILYTTKRADAEAWYRQVRADGIARSALMHGGSSEEDRDNLLARWGRDEVDLVVATSAFGLGVDKQDVRVVIHAALPESIDRFYQDVGRGGRDGWGSLSLLVWCAHDERPARSLAVPTFIGPERGLERWTAMFYTPSRAVLDDDVYTLPLDVAPSGRAGDIDMHGDENRLWNLRTVLLLARAGLIELTSAPVTGVGSNGGGSSVSDGPARWNQVTVRVCDYAVNDPATWTERVEPRRHAFLNASRGAWELMETAVRGDQCLSSVFASAYASRRRDVHVTRACGGCPACRRAGVRLRPGLMVARHTPAVPWPPAAVGPRLTRWLGGAPYGLIFYPASLTPSRAVAETWEVVRWLGDQQVTNLVVPREWLGQWTDGFARHPAWRVYLHDDLPTGVTQQLPTAVVVDAWRAERPDPWPHVWATLDRLPTPTVLLLPDNLVEPGRPDRLIRDILVGPPRLTLDQWQELYLE
jgi:ATP-dependent DNA helicase RecQ